MPIPNISSPAVGMGVEELTNLMFQYYRELQYLLGGQLDSTNVREITTDLLVAGTAKIDTALIEDLIVGANVQIGSAEDAAGVTTIIGNTVTTSYVNALNITADSVTASWVYAGRLGANDVVLANATSTASLNFDIEGTYYVTMKTAYTTGGNTLLICNTPSIGGTPYNLERMDIYADNVYFYGGVYIDDFASFNYDVEFNDIVYFYADAEFGVLSSVWFRGDVDFNGASVYNIGGYLSETESDLKYSLTTHDHGNAYVKTSQNLKIQWFSDHIEVSADGGSTWDVINFV